MTATAAADRSHRLHTRWHASPLRPWIPRIMGYLLVLLVWQLMSGRVVPAFALPPPATMADEITQIIASGQFWRHFATTLQTIAIGFALSFVLGLATGIAMAYTWADGFLRTWVVGCLNAPGLVFVLVATMIFGFSPLGPITAIMATASPFVTINIAEGVRAIPRDLLDMGQAFGVGEARRVRHVVIPFLAPYTFAAVRYGFSIAWKIATLAELFGGSAGIGFMIRHEFERFSLAGMLAWIFLFCAFALLLELLLQLGMRRYFRWRPQAFAH